MGKEKNNPPDNDDSSETFCRSRQFVAMRREHVESLIVASESPDNKLRKLQGVVESLRAVSGSPVTALRGILEMMMDRLENLAKAIELQLVEMKQHKGLDDDREGLRAILIDVNRIHSQIYANLHGRNGSARVEE